MRERLVSIVLFPILVILNLIWFLKFQNIGLEVLKNVVFLALIIALTSLYFSIKNQKITNVFQKYLGFGDILFLIAITPLFYNQNFVLFLITGMLSALCVHFLLLLIIKSTTKTIPLAGYLSIYLLAIIMLNSMSNINLFIYQFL